MKDFESRSNDDVLPPSEAVCSSFRAHGTPQLLEGGEGKTYRVGDTILKRSVDEEESIWRAELISSIPRDGFRLADPIKSIDGKWVCQGWEATTFVAGNETKERAREKIVVSRKFHAQLRDQKKPPYIDQAMHPWAIADRMTWGELPLVYGDALRTTVGPLLEMQRPIALENQLIHGDMTGNILFHPTEYPAIIDLSLYWRPREYPTAVIIIDSIVWNGESDTLIDELADSGEMNQLLVRAALWRIVTSEQYHRQNGNSPMDDVAAYAHVIDLLSKRQLS